jgi:perosamine synthetase
MKVPVAAPDLSGNEESYVVDAIRSSWISSAGPYLSRFEREFAELCGANHAVAVANGTVAVHLALAGLGIGPGDEVIVPSLTYVASVNAITYVGATPVFVDVDETSWCLAPEAVRSAISKRTRAVIAVHLYGQPADMDSLLKICDPLGIPVIEDAAEAPLASYHQRSVGSLGRVATFSFYGNKLLSCGEGGALTTDSLELADRIRQLRGQGMDPHRRYWFPVIGYNYRMTNVAAALLCAQLERREEFVAERWRVFRRYDERLAGIDGLLFQADIPGSIRTPWLYSVLVQEDRFGCSRDDLMRHLAVTGIDTRPFFPPIHRLPPYIEGAMSRGTELAVTDRIAAQGINLPTFTGLDLASVDLICDEIIECGRLR